MRHWTNWMRRGGHSAGGYEPPETEAALRAALAEPATLAEPAAPGEDESYRRLMAVIADDMRLRQPAPARASWTAWSWMPAASVAVAAAIFAVIAFDAGVDRGVRIAQEQQPPAPIIIPAKPAPAKVPSGYYVPKPVVKPAIPAKAPKDEAPRPVNIRETPVERPMNAVLAHVTFGGLTEDQRELLRMYDRQTAADDWAAAAKSLQQLADMDPSSELAVNALQSAAEIYRTHLNDDATALSLLRKEMDLIQDQMKTVTDSERKTRLETQLQMVQVSVNMGDEASRTDAPATDSDKK